MLILAVRPGTPLNAKHLLAWLLFLMTTCSGCSEKPAPASKAGVENQSAESGSPEPPADPPARSQPPGTTSQATDELEAAGPPVSLSQPEPLFRIPKEVLELNPQRLAASGIHVLRSRRLVLLTDRDPDTVRDLPVLADQYFDFLERTCGPLRPSRSGEDFRAIGCLMSDFELFQSNGLVPGPVVEMRHGQQFGYRFWMRDQKDDYYRRHLLLHEFAHVYMTCDTGLSDIPAGWFMEGAAEVFATHATANGATQFGILPPQFSGFEGWGRISEIRRRRLDRVATEFTLQTIPSIAQVQFPSGQQARDEVRYAWWWALSWMLCNHPAYSDDWTELCHCRGADPFQELANKMANRHGQKLSVDWLLFAESLCESFDVSRSFPQHRESGEPVPDELALLADRSWQDTGWDLTEDLSVVLECSGRSTIEETTAPWISQPAGVTLEYNHGRPLGEVVAVLVDHKGGWISRRIAVGTGVTIASPRPGRLWLQINDSAGARARNSGAYRVTFQQKVTPRSLGPLSRE